VRNIIGVIDPFFKVNRRIIYRLCYVFDTPNTLAHTNPLQEQQDYRILLTILLKDGFEHWDSPLIRVNLLHYCDIMDWGIEPNHEKFQLCRTDFPLF
jgi:hypothetical protein